MDVSLLNFSPRSVEKNPECSVLFYSEFITAYGTDTEILLTGKDVFLKKEHKLPLKLKKKKVLKKLNKKIKNKIKILKLLF